jgi:hypothetical protein
MGIGLRVYDTQTGFKKSEGPSNYFVR